MKLPSIPLALLACALLAGTGCKSPNPPAPTPRTSSAESPDRSANVQTVSGNHRGRPATNSEPGTFDFYLLNLSWSPEFCHTHPGNPQCAARPGFIVHGLWPQNNDGTYPEHCTGMTKPPNSAAYLDIMPTIDLILHEWQTHGTCTGLNPEGYFSAIGVHVIRGRNIRASDRADTKPVVVINETMARRFWPNENPILAVHAVDGSGPGAGPFSLHLFGNAGSTRSQSGARTEPSAPGRRERG